MPTTTAPPILIWQPGGGTPVGPVSNPPVYSQADITQLVIGQAYVDVVFGSIQTDNSWVLVECDVVNTADLTPLNIWPGIITNRTTAGFRVWLNGLPDSGNYYLHWAVSGVNILPVPASLYLFTGPTSSAFGVNKTFTVKLPPSTTLSSPVTVTPNDGGLGGTFSPPTVTLSSGSATATFTYNAVAYGAATLSVTNSGTLIDPAPIVYTSIAPTYTFTGPSGGVSGVPSTNFTVQLPGDATLVVPTTITPHDGGSGGTFTPTTVLLVAGVPVHFTYTPASAGNKTISVTNNGGLADPASLVYSVTSPFDPTAIAGCKLWLKADALALSDGTAISSWTDSSGLANHALGTTTTRPIFKTGIVNGKPVVRFDGVDDILLLTSEISFAANADFCLFVVYQTTGDGLLLGSASANNQLIRVGQSGNNRYDFFDGGTGGQFSNTLSVARTAWNIAFIARASVGLIFFSDASGFLNAPGSAPGACKCGTIGALGSPLALFSTGDIAEVLVYDNAVSGSGDQLAIITYLKTKYAIP